MKTTFPNPVTVLLLLTTSPEPQRFKGVKSIDFEPGCCLTVVCNEHDQEIGAFSTAVGWRLDSTAASEDIASRGANAADKSGVREIASALHRFTG